MRAPHSVASEAARRIILVLCIIGFLPFSSCKDPLQLVRPVLICTCTCICVRFSPVDVLSSTSLPGSIAYAGTALVLSVKFSFARTLSGSSALSRFRSVSASHARRALSWRAWLSRARLCFRPRALSLEHARAPCLPVFLPRSLALVRAQFLSLPLSSSLSLSPPRSSSPPFSPLLS